MSKTILYHCKNFNCFDNKNSVQNLQLFCRMCYVVILKKNQSVQLQLRVLTKAVCGNIFSRIENRVLRSSFIYKIIILNIFTLIMKDSINNEIVDFNIY